MPASRTAQTYRYELYRAVAAGIIETANATFLLLIAVRWFQAGAYAKGMVAAGFSGLGYLITPLVVSAVGNLRVPAARAAAWLSGAGAVALTVAILVPWLSVFVVATVVAMAAAGALAPLLTQIYQDNYPDDARGRFFSRTIMLRIVTATAFSFGGGALLAADIGYWRAMMAIFAASLGFSAWCLNRIPSAPLHYTTGHPFRAMRYAYEDRMFRTTLISWMLMGFANLMMLPLRVEYLANPRYHLELRPDVIALLTGVVPNLARLLLSPVWGRLFDRANFFVVRMTLNMGFALGIAAFFTSDTMPGFVLSAIIYGISVAGGDVAWTLWVTKIAPPHRVADYMSVHTFFTGVRGLTAPLIGFLLVERYSLSGAGWFSAAMIVGATLVLLPEVKHGGLVRQPDRPGAGREIVPLHSRDGDS